MVSRDVNAVCERLREPLLLHRPAPKEYRQVEMQVGGPVGGGVTGALPLVLPVAPSH